jgi:hypothetical protein
MKPEGQVKAHNFEPLIPAAQHKDRSCTLVPALFEWLENSSQNLLSFQRSLSSCVAFFGDLLAVANSITLLISHAAI